MREQISAEAITAALDQTNPNGPKLRDEFTWRDTMRHDKSTNLSFRPNSSSLCVIVYRDDFEVNYILFGEFVAILILIKYIKSEIYFVEHVFDIL